MHNQLCPDCGSMLVEDAAERIEIKKDGSILMDGFLAAVCEGKCGFYQKMNRDDELPRIIADRGDALLLLYSEDQGRIYSKRDNVLHSLMHYEALLKFGGWEDYEGEETAKWIDVYARKQDEPKSLFSFGTSELSQDAFLCWLLQWAAPELAEKDEALHHTAMLFLQRMFEKQERTLPPVRSVDIRRQFKGLDVLMLVNEEWAVLIEDKTYTKDHSDQLIRYKEAVKNSPEYGLYEQICIYYKSGSQSHYRSCLTAGYAPFTRKDMLEVLEEGVRTGAAHAILLDYQKHLFIIEASEQSYRFLPLKEWKAAAWQGFFQRVQQELDTGNWGYVANARGGFLGFWWNQDQHKACYFQLEEKRFCIKIVEPEEEKQTESRLQAFGKLLEQESVIHSAFAKPKKAGKGVVMTLMTDDRYIRTDEQGMVDVAGTIQYIKEMQKSIVLP